MSQPASASERSETPWCRANFSMPAGASKPAYLPRSLRRPRPSSRKKCARKIYSMVFREGAEDGARPISDLSFRRAGAFGMSPRAIALTYIRSGASGASKVGDEEPCRNDEPRWQAELAPELAATPGPALLLLLAQTLTAESTLVPSRIAMPPFNAVFDNDDLLQLVLRVARPQRSAWHVGSIAASARSQTPRHTHELSNTWMSSCLMDSLKRHQLRGRSTPTRSTRGYSPRWSMHAGRMWWPLWSRPRRRSRANCPNCTSWRLTCIGPSHSQRTSFETCCSTTSHRTRRPT